MLRPPTYKGLAPFPAPSSSVPPPETNVQQDTVFALRGYSQNRKIETMFRHSGWIMDKGRVEDALRESGLSLGRWARFTSCGQGAVVVRDKNDPTSYKIRASYCHDRFCKPCSRTRAHVIADNIAHIAPTNNLRFLTLTLPAPNITLVQTIDTIFKAFRRLRRGTGWQRNVHGGAAFLETKWNDATDRWHTHLHVMIEGDYYPQKQLKDEWTAATGGANIVHITRIRDRRMTLRYVTKYGTKAIDTTTLRYPDKLLEAIHALRGRRLVLTFGAWRGLRTKPKQATTDWEDIAPLSAILRQAATNDPDALYVLGKLGYSDGHRVAIDALSNPP